jgi:hypothetical protein
MDISRYMGGLLLFYETLNIDGLKAAYIDGYEASSSALKQRYEQHRRQPNRIDIAYRRGIDQTVREVVLYGPETSNCSEIVDRLVTSVPEEDQAAVRKRIAEKLEALSPDTAAMYGLRVDDVEGYLELRAKRP